MAITAILTLAWGSVAGSVSGSVQGWGHYNSNGKPPGLTNVVSVKAAMGYTFALKSDGTVVLWGGTGLSVPTNLVDVTQIAAGYYMPMALTADGKVHVWGADGHVYQNAIINPPASATNVIAIAGGMDHCLALRADGTVVAWGENLWGQNNVPSTLTNVVRIAAGQGYSLAITASGQIVAWGNLDFYGGRLPDTTNLVDVAINPFGHALGLQRDGTVVTWGADNDGLANPPANLTNVVAIAAGDSQDAALLSDGSVICWGASSTGLGSLPQRVTTAKAVAVGNGFTVVISDAPTIDQSGNDQQVFAGDDIELTASVSGPAPWNCVWYKDGVLLDQTNTPLVLHDIQGADAGQYWLVASNQFGFDQSRGINVIVYGSGPRWKKQPENQAVLPGHSACFVADACGLEPLQYQWFHNGAQLTNATNATLEISAVTPADDGSYSVRVSNSEGSIDSELRYLAAFAPIVLAQPTDFSARTNWNFSLSVDILCPLPVSYQWFKDGVALDGETNSVINFAHFQGSNTGGYQAEFSCDYGKYRSREAEVLVFTEVPTLSEPAIIVDWKTSSRVGPADFTVETNAVAIARGTAHTLVQRMDGSLAVYADQSAPNRLTIPKEATNVARIVAGMNYNLAIRKDGTVVGWGDDFGDNSQFRDVTNIVAGAIGDYGVFLLKNDGTLIAIPGDIYVPPNATNILAVDITSEYAVALRADGRVLNWWTWGPSQAPVQPVPGVEGVVGVAACWWDSFVLRKDGTMVRLPSSVLGAPTVVPGVTNAIAVTGTDPTILLDNGEVRGRGEFGSIDVVAPGLNACRIASGAALTQYPFFEKHPQSQTQYVGETFSFQTAARSATPLTYQWYWQGNPIPGATNASLQIDSARSSQSGSYKVVARNARYETTSSEALLSVEGPPDIQCASNSLGLLAGGDLNLEATYVSYPPCVFQWYFNSQPIPGATNATLHVVNVSEQMTGTYSLQGSNAYGVVRGPDIAVNISPSAPIILTQPTAPAALPDGSPLALQVTAVGSKPIAYQWFFNQAQILGATQAVFQIDLVSAANDGTYSVIISNSIGSTSSAPVQVTTRRSAPDPKITPKTLLVREGKPIRLQTLPGGTAGCTYRWFFNGIEIPEETNDVLSIPAAALTNSGSYAALASNAYGTNLSPGTTVRVLPARKAGLVKAWGAVAPPKGPVIAEAVASGSGHALALSPDGTVWAWGNNTYQQTNVPAGLSNAVAIAAGMDFSLALKSDGTVVAWGRNHFGQTSVPVGLEDVVAISAGSLHALALKSDGTVVGWGDTNAIGNLPHLVSAVGASCYTLGVTSNRTVGVWGTPSNRSLTNIPSSATNIIAVAGSATAAYAIDSSGGVIAWPATAPARPPEATNLAAIAAGSYHGVGLRADGRIVTWGSDSYWQVSGPKGETNIFSIAAGDASTLAISGKPGIFSAPSSQTLKAGSVVSLSPTVAGTLPLQFQWYLNNQPLTGCTNATLLLSLNSSNAGTYALEVGNAFATTRSNIAVINLGMPPSIVTQPADLVVTQGLNATFSVACSGNAPLTYSWALNDTNIYRATNSTITLSNVSREDQGHVSVRIENAFGFVTSRNALLTVYPKPSKLNVTFTNGILRARFAASPSYSYLLLSSTNLVDWEAVQTVKPTGTNFEVTLPSINDPARFYRLKVLNP